MRFCERPYSPNSPLMPPQISPRFIGLVLAWYIFHARRIVRRLRGHDPTPMAMILGEIWGGIKGLFGEYGRSQRRIAQIRAAA